MQEFQCSGSWLLAALDADGAAGETLARIRPIAEIADGGEKPVAGETPLFACATIEDATEAALIGAMRAGASGILFADDGGWDAVERLVVRLEVAETAVEQPAQRVSVLVLTTGARGILARAGLPPVIDRLIGLGIDGRVLAKDDRGGGGPGLATARGLTLLAAAAAGVPAFERHAGPSTTPALAASRADGFAWALVPDVPVSA